MATMLQSGLDLAPIITHRFPIEQYEEAFQVMASGCSGSSPPMAGIKAR